MGVLKLRESQGKSSIDPKTEPMVTVGEVTNYLIPKDYTLAVTLEISDATCGGLAMAVGMTTHSHKVGLYQESVVAYEIILADGSLIRVTKDNEHSDLFYALPWSHGTLGFLVSVELKIIPIKQFVKVEYIPVTGKKNYCDKLRYLSGALVENQNVPDFLEAILFSKDEAVIVVGNFQNPKPQDTVNNVCRWYKPWFYKHVKTFLNKGPSTEFLPIRQYLLRHNRSIFWVIEDMIPFGNNPLFRFLFGWLLPPKPAFLKFSTTSGIREMTFSKNVFQDIVLPMTVLEESIDISEDLFDTYPMLIYPCRIYNHGEEKGQLRPPRPDQMCSNSSYGMFYDLGVYGVPGPCKRKESYNPVKAMRSMERFIRKCGGYSFLYADIFMTKTEFKEMFDLKLYEKMRHKYGANNAFPHLYDKVKPEIDVFKKFL